MYEKLAQDRFFKIRDPTPAEEDVHLPRSHMITKTGLSKAGGLTPGCRKCRVMKEGDHSRTNLAPQCRVQARYVLLKILLTMSDSKQR